MAVRENDYWFKPKSYGYGATPINWKGWLLVLVFVIWALAISTLFVVVPSMNGEEFNAANFWTWIVLLVGSVLALVFVSRAKTDGEWRWRWGEDR